MNIEERIKKVIASQLGVPLDKITNTTLLTQELGADSLDMVEIIMAMEDEFQLSFTDENIKISSVQDIVEYMNRALTEQGNV
jgi:acyl carrier protein